MVKEYYFFEIHHNNNDLKEVLSRLEGSPFRHRCCVEGLGFDCIHMVFYVLDIFGIIDLNTMDIPDYPPDWHLHNTRELLDEYMQEHVPCEKFNIGDRDLINGDIIASHYGKAASHVGFYYDGYVYQSLCNSGVRKINFNNQTFRKGMRFVYRVTGGVPV